MNNLIFVSGFENTGTRLISMILEKFNYETFYKKKTNASYDYLKGFFHTRFFNRYYFKKDNFSYFKNVLDNDIKNVDNCVIKHGHLCFMIDDLKKSYPNAKFIHCIRNSYDSLVKSSENYKTYGLNKTNNPDLQNKFDHYKLWYSDDILSKCNIIISMEDLVFNPKDTITYLINKLNIKYDEQIVNECCSFIKPSKTIGTGKKKLANIDKTLNNHINNFYNHILQLINN